ncbi:MAG: peptide-methionine (S)-S-oxide reductase MsrA [Gemmatimonadota bacterium]
MNLIVLLLLSLSLSQSQSQTAKATFAGGCFWCREEVMDKVPGVLSTTSGYIGGRTANPTYEQVSDGGTGHAEAVEVVYDPARVSYAKLLDVFWKNIDPTTRDRQFCDGGNQYRAAIFYHDGEQQRLAQASKQKLVDSKRFKNVYVEVAQTTRFYPAEEYHQDYYIKNPARYKYYKFSCGREQTLQRVWGRK